jgi:predicted Zn-dependent protease
MIEDIASKLKTTCSWFDIYQSEYKSTPIEFRNNKLYSIQENNNSGTGIRLNKNGKTGFSYTNNSDEIENSAKKAEELSVFGDTEDLELPAKQKYPDVKKRVFIRI